MQKCRVRISKCRNAGVGESRNAGMQGNAEMQGKAEIERVRSLLG
jgi:hypothetical protein